MTEIREKLSRALLDCEGCLMTVLTRKLEIVWFNESMAKEFGRLEEFKGRRCYEAFAGDDAPHSGCAVQTAIRTGCIERAVERLGGRQHLVIAMPLDDELIGEVIIEIPEKEHTL